MIPSIGSDWNTVRGTSPVPGGISMNITSRSPHATSVQNCVTAPAITGPLHTTGSLSFSVSKLSDITLISDALLPGIIPISLP